ncbi:hypothetical protein E2562_027462 [Oryza meyeriana var. granulata]|uniref:Uncharacterized protein n=1 Tax=Oryza meyeriana var. granulata TaxID=110450 RepID=A0A6G1CJ10_9ORYZ|nr:hypothetical protein E2562_027462 [Oryza meyeriana var. granulata]
MASSRGLLATTVAVSVSLTSVKEKVKKHAMAKVKLTDGQDPRVRPPPQPSDPTRCAPSDGQDLPRLAHLRLVIVVSGCLLNI